MVQQVKHSPLFDGLNPKQLEAVRDTVHQSALVLASAGSGKTAVLIRRIAYLIELGIHPSQIMAVTFTNKASLEMQNRLETMVPKDIAKSVMMGTFHKICIRMLKRFGDRVGLDRSFAIASPSDQTAAMKKVLTAMNGDTSADNIKMLLSVISGIKGDLHTPGEYLANIAGDQQNWRIQSTYDTYVGYQDQLQKLNMLDFDDLIFYAVKLLESSYETRAFYQKQYQYVMLDEYQDTNPSQYRLMALIAGKEMATKPNPSNVMAVGDDFQAIYSFRGSDMEIILGFQRDFPEARTIKLEQNYRSTKAIVHTGNNLIKHNVKQTQKTSFTANDNGEKIKVYRASRSDEEANFVASEIKNLLAYGGYKEEDIAILYRMNSLSREMEKELIDARIKYKIIKGTGFFDRMEVRDTLAYMKIIANPKDDLAMERILGLTPGIGKTSVDAIYDEARSLGVGLAEGMKYFKPKRKQLENAIADLRQLLTDLYMIYNVSKTQKREDPISKMLEIVWSRTGYMEKLKQQKSEETMARLDNLAELKRVATFYEQNTEDASLEDFLEGITLQTSDDKEAKGEHVSLMTVHASKGLEFPVVFVIGMNEEVFPHKNSFEIEEGLEEERRLAYVAITRAEKLLYLSYAKSRLMFGMPQRLAPSRFLAELPKEAIDSLI